MNDIIGSWLAEQERRQRALFLILDRQAESQLPVSLPTTLLASRINLYRDSEAASLAELGPWLIGVPDPHADWLLAWLEQAEHHWGWLASAGRADPVPLLRHWRELILIREQGHRTLYRFQDNRVIARHLAALEPTTQRHLLLGPICSCLAWDGQQWRVFDNPNPGSHAPGNAPWLSVPEPEAIQTAIRRHNLEQWLWQEHCAALCRLLHEQDFATWLDRQLARAREWGWLDQDSQQFLLAHQLQPGLAEHPAWLPRDGETPAEHLARCRDFFIHPEVVA